MSFMHIVSLSGLAIASVVAGIVMLASELRWYKKLTFAVLCLIAPVWFFASLSRPPRYEELIPAKVQLLKTDNADTQHKVAVFKSDKSNHPIIVLLPLALADTAEGETVYIGVPSPGPYCGVSYYSPTRLGAVVIRKTPDSPHKYPCPVFIVDREAP